MPIGLDKQQQLAADETFVSRVQQAMITTAITVSTEPANTPGQADRLILAVQCLRNPRDHAKRFAIAVATQVGNISPSDANINTAVAAVWNAFAGFNPNANATPTP
jgi:hypothetical protein